MITIKEVITKRDYNRFIKFPDKLYKGNPYRATLLHKYERLILKKESNPAFEHCDAKYWMALNDGEVVGRIAAIINWKQEKEDGKQCGRFGWLDFIDDKDVVDSLFKVAEDWLRSKGVQIVQGPLGFSDMDLEGMLVEGFEELGTQAVLYNAPYYMQHVENAGYVKDVDWLQKEIKIPTEVPERLKRFSKLIAEKHNLRILKVKKSKELRPYAKDMFHTLNEAFSHLYGFVPLTDKQIEHFLNHYFDLIRHEFVCFVLNDKDEVVGFGIAMPSITKALIKAKGKLFPFGFIHILKALYGKNEVMDMYLNGVRPDYQGKGVHAIYYAELMQSFIDHGIKIAISNPQLEHNTRALQLWKHYEHRTHIRRRSYRKELL